MVTGPHASQSRSLTCYRFDPRHAPEPLASGPTIPTHQPRESLVDLSQTIEKWRNRKYTDLQEFEVSERHDRLDFVN